MGTSNAERDLEIYNKVQEGATQASVAREFGITAERVRGACWRVEKRKRQEQSGFWYATLSTRAKNALLSYNLTNKEAAFAAFSEPDILRKLPNVGQKTMSEIMSALGIKLQPERKTVKSVVLQWRSGEISSEQAMREISDMHN